MRSAHALPLVLSFLCACSAPVGPIPGGKLDGTVADWPSDWSFTNDIENVLLETNPEDPYSVTIWGVHHEGGFYIAAESERSNWAQNIARDSRVVLAIENDLYQAHARIVTDLNHINLVLDRLVAKYDLEREGGFVEDGGVLYRLERR